ncbi:hypothetical protein [Massilia litorea]|uniref:Uncharacterized protein n=1 Tax=Massilia litorea TaxID=2769491 RepID=A0A7L9U9G2_9BURK|nr:hypothetical protein [Massilia litorea]QOL51674.1 hypothetical protein LPB04_10700 [Massilia litorea]
MVEPANGVLFDNAEFGRCGESDAFLMQVESGQGNKTKKPLILSNQRLSEFWLRGQDLNL